MNFKCLCVALAILCLNGLLCYAESDLPEMNATSSVNSEGNAVFVVQKGTIGKKLVIELSKYPDFSVIDGFYQATPASFPKTYTMRKENRVNATYYWRIVEVTEGTASYSFKYFYGKDRTITYGTKIPDEYVAIEDSTRFEDFYPDDERSLQLKSVWFRSMNTGNKGSKIIDLPHATVVSPKAATEFTPDQSVVVKNDIVYVARGSSGWISAWRTDHTRVWLARYDLLTGEELPLLWVKAPDPDNGFVSGKWSLLSAMNWIKVDDDGTPYFFVTCSNSERPYLSQINLYTLNLDNLPVETQAVTATLTLQIEDDRAGENSYGCPFDMTVEGSIKSGNYKLWGVDYVHGASITVNSAGSGKMAVWQWAVAGPKAEKNVSYVDYLHSIDANNSRTMIQEFYAHITPVGNDYFYFHSAPVQKDDSWISPMLYRFVNGGACEVAGHFGNCRDIVTDIFPMPAGVSAFKVGETQFLAYGQGIDATRGTGIQIVATPSLTDDFSGHRKAWMLGEKTGLSTNRYQSCQTVYIPDLPIEEKNASEGTATGGRLLMYSANSGMGLYRINALSPTVGVNAVHETPLSVAYSAGVVRFDREVSGIVLYDISGRRICAIDKNSDTYAVGDLARGCYILSTLSSAAPVKIVVK